MLIYRLCVEKLRNYTCIVLSFSYKNILIFILNIHAFTLILNQYILDFNPTPRAKND